MNNLTWFQARDLAIAQGRAIRRAGWSQWLLYRGFLWLVSTTDAATQQETRRVATVDDFRDSEFLAKDWTDEVFTGGSYPPCTTPGPATMLAGSTSGGGGAWTTVAGQCAGAGVGGGVAPSGGGGGSTPALGGAIVCYSDAFVTPINHDSLSPVPYCVKVTWSLAAGAPGTEINCYYRSNELALSFSVGPGDAAAIGLIGDEPLVYTQRRSVFGNSGAFYFPNPTLPDASVRSGSLNSSGALVAEARLVLVDTTGARPVVLAYQDLTYRLWISGS